MLSSESAKKTRNKPEGESELADCRSLPENRTLREIFDRDKAAALDFATQLIELIPDIGLDGCFDDDPATDENRPMLPLLVAQQLRDALENLECVQRIMSKEMWA